MEHWMLGDYIPYIMQKGERDALHESLQNEYGEHLVTQAHEVYKKLLANIKISGNVADVPGTISRALPIVDEDDEDWEAWPDPTASSTAEKFALGTRDIVAAITDDMKKTVAKPFARHVDRAVSDEWLNPEGFDGKPLIELVSFHCHGYVFG